MALITAAQFREHYPKLEGTGQDALLATLITRADALMAAFCGYPQLDDGSFTLEDTTYTVYPHGPRRGGDPATVCLCIRPIVSITSVHVDTTRVYGAGSLLAEGTDYDVHNIAGSLDLLPGGSLEVWPVTRRAIKVVAVAGYTTTPPGLVAIAAQAVRHLWDLRAQSRETSVNFREGGADYSGADWLLPEAVQRALAPYRVGCS